MTKESSERSKRKNAPSPYRKWLCWGSFAFALLGASGYYSELAPLGVWVNEISGEPAWLESDPGSFYVASAHELAWGEQPLFVGHPGATLVPLLWGVQSALHLSSSVEMPFTRYTAQNLPTVFWVSKLLITMLHLASFAALYAASKRLLGDERAATLAVLAYASSFPVLFFLSRISVEPLMVLFLLLSFLAIWRYQDHALERRTAPALGFAALAAVAAMSGAMTKLSFLGPLPLFLALYLIIGRERRGVAAIDTRTRGLALATFVVVSGAALALYSQIIDWGDFIATWRMIVQETPVATGWGLRNFIPGRGSNHIFLLAELAFCSFAVVSFVSFVRSGQARERTLWFSGFALWGLLLFAYRVAFRGSFLPFHYFFIAQAGLAVFFGYGSVAIAARFGLPLAGAPALVAALAWIGLVHGVGAWIARDSRQHDAAMYAQRRPAFEQLAMLESADRIGVVESGRGAKRFWGGSLHGMDFPLFDTRPSVLVEEFARLFELVEAGSVAADAPRTWVPPIGAEIVILRPVARGAQ